VKPTYTQHLKERIRRRCFPGDYPRKIFYKPDYKFLDTKTGSNVSIKKLPYDEKYY